MEPLKPGSNTNAEGVRGDSQDPSGVPVPGNPAGSGSTLGSLTAKTSETPGETAGEGRPTRGRLATDSLSMPAPAAQTPPESTLFILKIFRKWNASTQKLGFCHAAESARNGLRKLQFAI